MEEPTTKEKFEMIINSVGVLPGNLICLMIMKFVRELKLDHDKADLNLRYDEIYEFLKGVDPAIQNFCLMAICTGLLQSNTGKNPPHLSGVPPADLDEIIKMVTEATKGIPEGSNPIDTSTPPVFRQGPL